MNNSSRTVTSMLVGEIPFSVRVGVYSFIMCFALVGNGLVIISILFVTRLRRISSNAFILNLAVCDVLSVLVNITWDLMESKSGSFPFGLFGCKIVPALGTFAIISSVLTLLAISLERFALIVYPLRFRSSWKVSSIAILCVHCVSLVSVIPYAQTLMYSVKSSPSCEETWGNTASRVYTVCLFLLQYGVPLPFIVVLYVISWLKIRRNNSKVIRALGKRHLVGELERARSVTFTSLARSRRVSESTIGEMRQRQTHRTMLMFTSVVLVFAVCMFPVQLIWFYRTFSGSNLDGITTAVFLWLTYSNSVLNPWIYGRFSPNFRSAYKTVGKILVKKLSEGSCVRKQISYALPIKPPSDSICNTCFEGCTSFVPRYSSSITCAEAISDGCHDAQPVPRAFCEIGVVMEIQDVRSVGFERPTPCCFVHEKANELHCSDKSLNLYSELLTGISLSARSQSSPLLMSMQDCENSDGKLCKFRKTSLPSDPLCYPR